ncbi:apolipoprotein N-acyltransferase [Paracoccus sp. (in: a-proteobacteria)]|uniref:apolipoprotein N-acyltransferase n=1 Tax=Paracoccus sp. TaxID=267 RepID=UPI0026DFCF41|nr:apolipoprotein N-acyltransferase [Paracoccus sp. (in: a-proteobacteria)]MDO5368932.1 apolipoprotein N-acyltransferase [Paracoccus sp. (in: a-proteobacteria)]
MQRAAGPPAKAVARPGGIAMAGRITADFAIGVIAATGQAPWGLWPLTLLALAAMLWRLSGVASARAAGLRALAFGTGHFALALFWITQPFLVEAEIYGWMSPFALILMALGGGLFWAVPAWIAHRSGRDRRSRAAALALAILVSDWLRGWIFTGFPWALTGHVWIDTPAGQVAAWFGAMGLSALTMGAALLIVLGTRPSRGPNWPAALLPGLGNAAMLIGAAWFAGLARLNQALPADQPRIIRLVQPNADQTLKWSPQWAPVFYERLTSFSALPLKPELGTGRPDAVVWPETAVPFLLEDAQPLLTDIAAASGATTITGIQRSEGSAWFNSLAEFTADARIGAIYDKFHLVPFGEYIPWGDALARFGITAFAAQYGNGYSSGPGPQVLALEGLPPFQPMICYETIFERHLMRGQRPEWILQVTNDAWFGAWSGPYQHLAQARLRAIQSGLPVLRAANTGVSAVIDARGEVRATLPLDRAGIIDARLPGALPPTLWWRWGDAPMLALMALAMGWLSIVRRRRH